MKKYSEKFIHEFSKLKKSKVGIEFEFYMKDLSFYKTLELLNKELAPVSVHGFRQYHSDFKPDSKNFKIEPDLSGGSNMVELVTGPMGYNDAKFYLIKILKFIQNYGYTNDKCSIHFNVSFFGDRDLNDLNILKLILNTDEEEIYRFFPSRKGNIYAKSVKKIIPFKEYDFFNIPIDVIKNNLVTPKDKYYGINFTNITNNRESQRVEYRYIGGKDYESNIGNICYFFDRFILDCHNSIDVGFDQSDANKLELYLEENISKFKSFSKYDNFIVEYPSIQIQIDQNHMYELINSYFPKIYEKLWDLIQGTEDLRDCIVNYITMTQKMEVVDGKVTSILPLHHFEFVNCEIFDGIYESCNFYGSSWDSLEMVICRKRIAESNSQNFRDCPRRNSLVNKS
jgi:hypothetical protein